MEHVQNMLYWYLALKEQRPIEVGILGSNLEKLLELELFHIYKKTYPAADYESIWESYQAVVSLWNIVGHRIAEQCDFEYPELQEKEMLQFVNNLKEGYFTQ